jgi:predicted Rossmann-fold nucleotide-binding protein
VAGYYDPLVALLDHAVAGGFVPAENRRLVLVDERPGALLDRMAAHEPPPGPGWVTPEEA